MRKIIFLIIALIGHFADAQNVTLTVNGPSGNLYVNEIYTGKQAPATISVQAGKIRIGIGNSDGYFQKTATISSNTTIDLNNLHPLPRRSFKMAIVAPRWTSHGGEMAYLEDTDLVMAETTAKRASVEDVTFAMYNMVDWDVDVMPIVENVTLNRGGDPENWPDVTAYLKDAGLSYLQNEYDAVLLFYSVFNQNGGYVKNAPCCLWGSKGAMSITNGSRYEFRDNPKKYIGEGYTHEWLHGIEQTSGIYVEGYLHGAAAHNYAIDANGSHDWRGWYWDFMKGIVPKVPGTPEQTDYVGHFPYLKNFLRDTWKDSETIIDPGLKDGVYTITAVHSNKYLSLKNNSDSLVQNTYQAKREQQWKLQNLGKGAYRITSMETGETVSLSEGKTYNGTGLVQQKYTGVNAQQWLIFPEGNNCFRIASRHSGRAMDVYGVSTSNNAQIVQWDYLGGDNQKWVFTPVSVQPFAGTSLRGEYYTGMNFDERVLERTDPVINFNWQQIAPAPAMPIDKFSVRWSGQIEPEFSGEYIFYLNSDNGRRLWINGVLVIDGWVDDWDKEYKGSIALQAREKYDIVVEYFENFGGANIKLEWESAGQSREIIPQEHLYPASILTSTLAYTDLSYGELYPNPVKGGSVNLKLLNTGSTVHYSIFTSDGRLIQSGTSTGNGIVSMEAPEEAGLYSVQISNGDQVVVKKLIVQ